MESFEIGDKVRLKSISPVMKVVGVKANAQTGKVESVECVWVSPKQKHYKDIFKPEELILVM